MVYRHLVFGNVEAIESHNLHSSSDYVISSDCIEDACFNSYQFEIAHDLARAQMQDLHHFSFGLLAAKPKDDK